MDTVTGTELYARAVWAVQELPAGEALDCLRIAEALTPVYKLRAGRRATIAACSALLAQLDDPRAGLAEVASQLEAQ